MSEIRFKCFECGTEVVAAQTPGRRDECLKCGADLHVCRNCKHYDPHAYNECRESAADVVREKDRSNFCDFFSPGAGGPTGADKAKDLKAAAEALFKKKS
jgi:hypothetical protein